MTQQALLHKALWKVKENKPFIEKDPNRLQFHLMPPVGLLNDPNGLIQYNGVYHVFYQWNPFETAHGAKFWGHYSSKDLVHWQEQPPALVPSEWYEKNGCYSGCAVEADRKLFLFYTGNVKDVNNQRETYQCMAVSEDGIHFEKRGPVIHTPKGYTPHFRDPKVWKRGGTWYMVLGAQTENEEGRVVLYDSEDLENWEYKGPVTGTNYNGLGDFGYMWECPDFFQLGSKDVLLVSPQGIKAKGHQYQNLFQSGYFIGEWNLENNEYKHGRFIELDRGFDFYAPQTFDDDQGRRIMYAWMGITDDKEAFQPTIANGWVHALTIPRELDLKGDRLYQKPVPELEMLRNSLDFDQQVSIENEEKSWPELKGVVSEIKMDVLQLKADMIEINIRGQIKLIYNQAEQLFTLERKSYKDQSLESRSCQLSSLEEIHVFLDTSSIEIFLNGGLEVFSARFFADPAHQEFTVSINGKLDVAMKKWSLHSPNGMCGLAL